MFTSPIILYTSHKGVYGKRGNGDKKGKTEDSCLWTVTLCHRVKCSQRF